MIFGEESPLGSEPPPSGWPKRSEQTGRTTSNRDASRSPANLLSAFELIVREGAAYASVEARSMIAGAIAFCAYACCVIYVLMRYRFRASVIASLFIVLWLGLSISLWAVWLR
jgi:hypothetical protein